MFFHLWKFMKSTLKGLYLYDIRQDPKKYIQLYVDVISASDKALAYFNILLVYLFLPLPPHYLIGYKHPDGLMTLSPLFNALQCQGCSISLPSADTRGHSARTRGGWCLSCFVLREVVVSLSSRSVLFVAAGAPQYFRNFLLPTCGSIGHERNRDCLCGNVTSLCQPGRKCRG